MAKQRQAKKTIINGQAYVNLVELWMNGEIYEIDINSEKLRKEAQIYNRIAMIIEMANRRARAGL